MDLEHLFITRRNLVAQLSAYPCVVSVVSLCTNVCFGCMTTECQQTKCCHKFLFANIFLSQFPFCPQIVVTSTSLPTECLLQVLFTHRMFSQIPFAHGLLSEVPLCPQNYCHNFLFAHWCKLFSFFSLTLYPFLLCDLWKATNRIVYSWAENN